MIRAPILVNADLLPADGFRTELDSIRIRPYSVDDSADVLDLWWTANRKHHFAQPETWPVRSDWIEARLAELEGGS